MNHRGTFEKIKGKKVAWGQWIHSDTEHHFCVPTMHLSDDGDGTFRGETYDRNGRSMGPGQFIYGGGLGTGLRQWQIIGEEKKGMIKEIVKDTREFAKENRGMIYTVTLIVLADHFFLKGALRDKIKGFLEKLLSRAEKSIEKV